MRVFLFAFENPVWCHFFRFCEPPTRRRLCNRLVCLLHQLHAARSPAASSTASTKGAFGPIRTRTISLYTTAPTSTLNQAPQRRTRTKKDKTKVTPPVGRMEAAAYSAASGSQPSRQQQQEQQRQQQQRFPHRRWTRGFLTSFCLRLRRHRRRRPQLPPPPSPAAGPGWPPPDHLRWRPRCCFPACTA